MTKNIIKKQVKDKPKDVGFKVTFHFDKPESVYFLLDWGSKSWTIECLKFDDLIKYFNDRGETVIDYPKLEYDYCTRDCKDGATLIAVRNRTDWKEILIREISHYTDDEGVSGYKNALIEYEKTLPYEINPNRKKKIKMKKKAKSKTFSYYDYSKTIYVDHYAPVVITCPKHGDFKITPKHHMDGLGCPKCFQVSLNQVMGEIMQGMLS